MKANEMQRDALAAFLETDEGKMYLHLLDCRWTPLMNTVRDAGFIIQAYGGTATLATYENMMEAQGVEGVVRMLQMNAVEMPEGVGE